MKKSKKRYIYILHSTCLEFIGFAFYSKFMYESEVYVCVLILYISISPRKCTLQDKEDEVKAAISAQQQHLGEGVNELEMEDVSSKPRFTINDALSAPPSLMHELTKKVTCTSFTGESSSKSKSIVKSIIVGKVPDRGKF